MASNTPFSPRRLYKYLPPERATVLDRRWLRHTPLSAFNDPFEGRPEITMIMSNEAATDRIRRELTKTFDPLLEAADACAARIQSLEHLGRRLEIAGKLHDNFQAIQALLSEVNTFAIASQPDMLAQLKAQTGSAVEQLQKQLDQQVGILSLSEVPDSLLMWSHYGASHTGFVLEFDADHASFCSQNPMESDFHQLHRVLYREARPSSPLDKIESDDLFFVKSWHWAYEREWRILRPLLEASATIPSDPFPIHLFEFPHEAVTGVILGARSTAATRASLIGSLCADSAYKHLRLRRAVPDPSHFLLRLVDEAI